MPAGRAAYLPPYAGGDSFAALLYPALPATAALGLLFSSRSSSMVLSRSWTSVRRIPPGAFAPASANGGPGGNSAVQPGATRCSVPHHSARTVNTCTLRLRLARISLHAHARRRAFAARWLFSGEYLFRAVGAGWWEGVGIASSNARLSALLPATAAGCCSLPDSLRHPGSLPEGRLRRKRRSAFSCARERACGMRAAAWRRGWLGVAGGCAAMEAVYLPPPAALPHALTLRRFWRLNIRAATTTPHHPACAFSTPGTCYTACMDAWEHFRRCVSGAALSPLYLLLLRGESPFCFGIIHSGDERCASFFGVCLVFSTVWRAAIADDARFAVAVLCMDVLRCVDTASLLVAKPLSGAAVA